MKGMLVQKRGDIILCQLKPQLCGYSRQECEKDTRGYPKSIKRRFGIRPNDTKGVY